ncbi:MAG TPA: DUF4396 domain-containing protein [Flavobacteriales bacterium]|nr:DUF4396 domain-containing protein [Flavobacteriales bacterium]
MEEHKQEHLHNQIKEPSQSKLAFSATLHCLLGCGIGEVAGIIIGTALVMSTINTLILAVGLGFVFGFILGMRPLLKAGFNVKRAFKTVFIAEGLSIFVMEATEVLVEVYTPGVMEGGLTSWVFWAGMLLALIAGFIAAFPVNYYLIGKGIRHQH